MARREPGPRLLGVAPFMHGAGMWYMLRVLTRGGLVAIPSTVTRFDAAQACELIERERLDTVVLVGEAFANPLARQTRQRDYDLDCVRLIGLGVGVTNTATKAALMAAMPNAGLFDSAGSSETGGIMRGVVAVGGRSERGVFTPSPRCCVATGTRPASSHPGRPSTGGSRRANRCRRAT